MDPVRTSFYGTAHVQCVVNAASGQALRRAFPYEFGILRPGRSYQFQAGNDHLFGL